MNTLSRYKVIIHFIGSKHLATYLFDTKQQAKDFAGWAMDHTVYSCELKDNINDKHVCWFKLPA